MQQTQDQKNRSVFSLALKNARISRKWMAKTLALKAGFKQSAISHFENKRRLPSFDNLIKLCDALKVKGDYFYGR